SKQSTTPDALLLYVEETESVASSRSLRLGHVPELSAGGVTYRAFGLDINQKQSQPFLSLDALRIYVGSVGNLTGYDAGTDQLSGLTPLFDLDEGGDHWGKLSSSLNPGSGKSDMAVYFPNQLFKVRTADSTVSLFFPFAD